MARPREERGGFGGGGGVAAGAAALAAHVAGSGTHAAAASIVARGSYDHSRSTTGWYIPCMELEGSSSLATRQFDAGTTRLYYEITLSKGTIWVPVEGSAGGLRPLTGQG